jgi:hypothetical protein
MADDIRQTKKDFPKVVFEFFAIFLANSPKISPPIVEPFSKPIIIDVKLLLA